MSQRKVPSDSCIVNNENRLFSAEGDLEMKSGKILFYGDSNTYGYDPANWQTLRYPYEQRWTTILAGLLGAEWQIIPEGMNGRRLPELPGDGRWLLPLLGRLGEGDIFAVMLGTNDLLLTPYPHAEEAIGRMRTFLQFLTDCAGNVNILVTAPPYVGREGITDPLYRKYRLECIKMNDGFRGLAAQAGAHFADAGKWDISLSGDLVHFSESGHRRYAEKMAEVIRALQK